MVFLDNFGFIFQIIGIIAVIIVLLIIIFVLYKINKKEELILKDEKMKIQKYIDSLDQISTKNSNDIEKFNRLFRGFLKELYGLDFNLTYLEVSKEFKNKGNKKLANFSTTMSEKIYSGKKLTSIDFDKIKSEFLSILRDINEE